PPTNPQSRGSWADGLVPLPVPGSAKPIGSKRTFTDWDFASIDYRSLVAQWMAVAAIGFVLCFLIRVKFHRTGQPQETGLDSVNEPKPAGEDESQSAADSKGRS